MRLAISPRFSRLLGRLPRSSLLSLTELALLALLAAQGARLFWAVATPIGPLGEWRPAAGPDAERGRAVLASGFDPFFRASGGNGPTLVTSLQLKLFGIRLNEATGRGSAIIAGADNVQSSYSVGEAIQPGVVLKSVGYDNVVIAHDGRDETLFIDQSGEAPMAAPAAPAPANISLLSAPATAPTPGSAVTLAQLQSQLTLAPRQSGGRVTGLVPRGDPSFLARLGLRPGDIVVQVAGRPIGDAGDLQRAAAGLANGGVLSIGVERGAQIVPVAISISGQ
jgi:general secretion pathway protein C